MADLMAMYREKAPSTSEKTLFTMLHLGIVLVVAWLLFAGGISRISEWLHLAPTISPGLRRTLLLAASAVYFLRVLVSNFTFMKRRMSWSEVGTVAAFIGVVHLSLAFIGGRQAAPVGWVEGLGALLYVVGSYLNSGSEYQRYLWKQHSRRQGQLYTRGLFQYAIHINYFGDVVLFTGWVLLAARWILFVIPLFMLLNFIFLYVPTLDRYLAERYGQAFHDYGVRTRKLIPFLY